MEHETYPTEIQRPRTAERFGLHSHAERGNDTHDDITLLPTTPSSFPRSSVGTHTDLASATPAWVPTEDRGNQKPLPLAPCPLPRSSFLFLLSPFPIISGAKRE